MICDLTQSITEGSKGGIARDLFYTLIGGVASWFLFTNAALHVGWAPNDDLLGLSRKAWAMIMALLIVLVIFALSARRQPVKEGPNLQAIGRFVEMYAPHAPTQVKTQLMAAILTEAAKYGETNHLPKALPAATVIEPAAKPASPALQIPPQNASRCPRRRWRWRTGLT